MAKVDSIPQSGGMVEFFNTSLRDSDPALQSAIDEELGRQQHEIELIASENIVSRAVLEAQGSVMTNKLSLIHI